MPFLRREPRIPPTGKVTLRLTPAQRNLLTGDRDLPPSIIHRLRGAVVREGKLGVRVSREEVELLIAAGARQPAPDRAAEFALIALAKYLESMADRFEDPADSGD